MKALSFVLLLGMTLLTLGGIVGCSDEAGPQGNESNATNGAANEEQTHGGWWCYEHGVPEEKCAMCNSELAASMRADGDWCETHSRPESLCFKCDPSRADQFVALYEAKYGKKPPAAKD